MISSDKSVTLSLHPDLEYMSNSNLCYKSRVFCAIHTYDCIWPDFIAYAETDWFTEVMLYYLIAISKWLYAVVKYIDKHEGSYISCISGS